MKAISFTSVRLLKENIPRENIKNEVSKVSRRHFLNPFATVFTIENNSKNLDIYLAKGRDARYLNRFYKLIHESSKLPTRKRQLLEYLARASYEAHKAIIDKTNFNFDLEKKLRKFVLK